MNKERLLLVILAAIQFTNIVDFMIMMPMGDILKKALAITPIQYGLLVSSYGLAAGITAFLGVFYLDYLDRKKALLTAYFGFMLATLSSAIVPTTADAHLNYYLFIGTRILTGISGGLLGGLVLAIIADVIPIERRGKAMAVVTIAFSLASILGIPLSLMLVDAWGGNWHIPFYGVSLLSLPIWFLALKYIPAMDAHVALVRARSSRFETIRFVFKTPLTRTALMFTVLLVLGHFTVISFLTPYYINNVGLMQSDLKYIYLTGGIATVATGFFIGRLVDTLGRFRVFTIFAALSTIPVLIITHLPVVPLWVVLLNSTFFFIFIGGRMIAANTISSAIVPPQHRAGFMSLNSACVSFAGGLSAVLAGSIVTQATEHSAILGYQYVGYLAVAATVVSLILIRMQKGMAKNQTETSE